MGTGRALLVSIATALAGMVGLDLAYGRYAQKHFIPNAILAGAEASGDGCLVTLGDSRMVAGIDPSALAGGLRTGGAAWCIAPLAVGKLPISGSAMALRRLVADGKKPGVVLLGESSGTLLPDEEPPDPSDLVGNRAAELAWSLPSDVTIYYPEFPFGDLDRGIRFSLARASALETYESATWMKVQTLQERLVGGRRVEPRNRFGAVSDMRVLLGRSRAGALDALAHYDGHWRASPWFELLLDVAHRSGAHVVVIEVPMPSTYREEVLATPEATRYRKWLRSELERTRDAFLDMSSPSSVTDEDFPDGLHLREEGAARFSAELGQELAPMLRPLGP